MIANRYEVKSTLGSGGMGTVYKGYDTLTRQIVAIKELRPELVHPDYIERFKREGEALRELDHPNIVKLLDTVFDNQSYYLVLEYVAGGDLNDLIRLEQLSNDRILTLAIDLADALTRAHKLQIIHRDLKPANILVANDGTLRLTDFGIAHVSRKERVTDVASIMGTVDYLSPEMLNGSVIDSRVDIWAFGVILFEMLAGRHPFKDESITTTITNILTEPPPDLESLRPDAPISLIDLVYRMLERDPQARIASARHVGAELEDILHDRQKPALPYNRFITPLEEKLTRPKYNLPSQATPFVGREREIETLTQLLSNPQIRLVTVLAPGGMGKTRLSLEVAKRQMGVFANGIFFVELTALTDTATIPSAIADAIGYQLQVDEREPKQQILDYLTNKHMLLVIDNWEHLIDGAVIVSEIFQAAADVKILVTSRERLNLQEETVFRVDGMDVPDQDTPPDEVEHSAVKLFVQSAKRALPAFKLAAHDMKHIIRICRLVEGMPLGILLAAAWLDTLSLQEIGDEIGKSLNFLETEAQNVPSRQRSIRAVFDYSWNLITGIERDVLMKLSIFRGGFTREAAQHVAGATLRQLASLVNKSLISRETDTGRYRIHELLRQYSAAQFHEHQGNAIQVGDLHCEFYTGFVHDHVAMHGGNQIQATAELDGDLENIRAAWRWATEHGKVEDILRSAHTLHLFYQFHSRYLEGTDAFEKAAHSLELLEPTNQQQYALAIVLVDLGWFYLRLGQIDDARSVLERSQTIFEALQVPPPAQAAAHPLPALSIVTVVLGNYSKAIQIGEEAYQDCLARGDKGNLISCSLALASAYVAQGDFQTASQVAQRGCGFAQELGHDYLHSYCLNLLGNATQALGDYEAARQHYQTSYTLREKFNDPEGMAVALNHLGKLAWTQGNYAEAKLHYQRSHALYQNIGDKGGLAGSLLGLGLADCKLEDDQSAMKHFYAALSTALDARLMPLVLTVIISIIELFPARWSLQLALELLVLTLDRPGGDYETRDKAQKLLTGYAVSPERLAEIRHTADFAKATSALMNELRKPPVMPAPAHTSQPDTRQPVEPLTERELEILHFIASGLSNHEIASKLFISIGTVKWYCSQIYAKFGVKSRTQAVLLARQLNL